MGLLVVLLFTVPVLVGLAVVAVKTIEFTVSRDIASSKVVARRTMLLVLGATAIGLVAWFVYVAMGMPSMRAMGMLVLWFAGTALVGAVIQRTKLFRRATPLVFFLGIGVFLVAALAFILAPPLWFYMGAAGVGWISGFVGVAFSSQFRA